jgi:hypothetical protein
MAQNPLVNKGIKKKILFILRLPDFEKIDPIKVTVICRYIIYAIGFARGCMNRIVWQKPVFFR